METIAQSGAEQIIATHGYTIPLVRYLRERGQEAIAFETRFKGEGDDDDSIDEEPAPTV